MKKNLLFSLIGAIIIFMWQFISFAMPNLHKSGMDYTPLQDSILQRLQDLGLKEGMYMLGQPDPALMADHAKFEEAMMQYEGKPWGLLNYHMNHSSAMGMNMLRGFIICFIISWILFWIMKQLKENSLKTSILLSLGVGFISFLFVPYTNFIWFKDPDIWAYMLDGIIPWIIMGVLGNRMAPNA